MIQDPAEVPSRPKLRLLKHVPDNSDPVLYDCTARRSAPRPCRAGALPEWNSDVDVRKIADNDNLQGNESLISKPPLPRRRPVQKPSKPLPEWNADTSVAAATEDDVKQSLPISRSQDPRRRYPSTQVAASANAVETNSVSDVEMLRSRQQKPSARTGGQGKVAPASTLPDDASLMDSVPIRWPPSRHHVAELLNGSGCVTVGNFRLFLKEAPFEKIVDAIVTADASCAAPGGIRDRKDAQKCIEELTHLVRADEHQVLIRKAAPDVALKSSSALDAAAFLEKAVVDTVIPDSVLGKSGCPRCGRDVTGRALVMHLKTCRPRGVQPKRADPFAGTSEPGHARPSSPPLPAHANLHPASPSLPSNYAKQIGSQKVEAVTDVPAARPIQGQKSFGDAMPQAIEFPGISSSEAEAAEAEPHFPCPHCGRTFRQNVLERHIGKCLTINRERKKFNALAQALPSEAIQVHKVAEKRADKQRAMASKDECIKPVAQTPAWKAKSEAFRNAIKEGRAVAKCIKEGRPLSQLPPSKPAAPELDDRIQCQHCGRRFGQQQAERHIPICPKGRGRGGKGRR